jgi:hypothetical protein
VTAAMTLAKILPFKSRLCYIQRPPRIGLPRDVAKISLCVRAAGLSAGCGQGYYGIQVR